MNPNLVRVAATLLVAATKLKMLSQEGSEPFYYLINLIFLYVFWGSMRDISHVVSGKNYIIISPKYGPEYKAYRKEQPFWYCLNLGASTLFATFVLGIFFRHDLVERVLDFFL
jgi:hypothetical protein